MESKRIRITKNIGKNNVIIIIEADDMKDYKEIENELLECVRKIRRRTKELGYYITPKEKTRSVMTEKFFNFSLEIPKESIKTLKPFKH